MKTIALFDGKAAIVDDEDYKRVNALRWTYSCRRGKYQMQEYALHCHQRDGKITTLKMHRFILNAKKGEIVDHKDFDGLNNQRSNLRIVTWSQNMWHRRKCRAGKYIGVWYNKRTDRWIAKVKKNGRLFSKYCKSEMEAVKARDLLAKHLHGDFAVFNTGQ